ncbi:MAG: radical SAM protein [Eubacterium sp.]|nr:radical SAM protein [Eubacterium sp.]
MTKALTKNEIKTKNLDILAGHQAKLCKEPELRKLFFELTLKCNEHCFHCGSGCSVDMPDGLPVEEYMAILDEVKKNFGTGVYIALTGGEPLMYKDFFKLTGYIQSLGMKWGMTSNATLITKSVAERLRDTGMRGISVSIDGLPDTHDRYRSFPNGFKKAMDGIQNMIDAGGIGSIMVTTVVNHENIVELDALYDIFDNVDINEWRLTGIEPIGRALEHPEMLLTPEDNIRLMKFIKEKREQKIPVEYSCCHFLGKEYEAEVRDWYFLCNAGIYVAGIFVNGDVGACLDVPRNERTIQGNIHDRSFTDIWKDEFKIFRTPLDTLNEKCSSCPEKKWCRGGSYHSWDYDDDHQKVCFKDVLF